MNQLGAVIYKCRHHPAYHPASRNGADDQQDKQCRGNSGNVVYDSCLYSFPTHFTHAHGNKRTYGGCGKQRNLTASVQCITPESTDCYK